ncbi:energy transducer TonB [Pedobacter nutrimenti]|uniref:TonB family protein n=1 Tax=Pedobacter nutrimenti TaxID=1241337 RepID=A0A318UCF1_9SPHI|nr:energy transducer TonB [Pedobacter nutrimenti]PYF74054.1 TonB family protein [Pedobacter nutrimenti]
MKKYIVLLTACLFFIMTGSVCGQSIDTIWYNNKWKETTVPSEHYYFRTIKSKSDHTFEVIDHFPDGKPQMVGTFTSLKPENRNGTFFYYNSAGILEEKQIYFNNMVGEVFVYKEDGKLELHKIQAEYLATLSREEKKSRYNIIEVDKEPEYVDGQEAIMKFIRENTKYPDAARKRGAYGRVMVALTIDEHGKIAGIRIAKKTDPDLDQEALRVARLIPEKFIPAMDQGKNITRDYAIPFNFQR